MKRIYNLKYTILSLTCLLGLSCLSSCIYDNELCTDSPDENGLTAAQSDVTLRMTLTTQGGRSRADHTNEGEEPGNDPENYINLDDLQLLLFDGNKEFLQNLHPSKIVKNDDGTYDMTMHIQDKYFSENLTSANIPFYILALANGRTLGAPYLNVFQAGTTAPDGTIRQDGTTLNQVMTQLQSTTMNLKPDTYSLLQAGTDDPAAQYMPMSGIQYYTIPGADLKATSETNPYDLTAELNLLRALTKIEVVDKINYTGQFTDAIADNNERIEKIEIAGYVNAGNMLPLMSQWSDGPIAMSTKNLTSPCIPAGASYINPPTFDREFKNIIGWDGTMRLQFERTGSRADDNAPVFSCYVYEYLNPATGAYGTVQQPPYLNITTKDNMIYPMRLATYTDGESTDDDYLTELVRNHIYRYEITAIESFKANLTYTVMDWEQETTNWVYTDNIGIADGGELNWTGNTYLSINESTANVTMLRDGSPLEGKFTLAQPMNAEWRALFVPIGDTPADAFVFRWTDADGQVQEETSITGTIDGKQTTLTIVPTILDNQINYSARLQVIVTLPGGQTMNADICNGKYGNNKFFTINQNSQL